MTRSQTEIDKIREASSIVAETLELVRQNIEPGVTTQVLDEMAEEYIRSRGARPAFKGYYGFPATLCISIDNEVVHGIPGDRKLQPGEIVSIDCGAEKNGYYGDHARTFAVGEIDDVRQRLLATTQTALEKGIAQAHDGNRLFDIGHAVQEYAESQGFSVVRQLVGHAIGTQLHEEPQVPNYGKAGTGPELQAGMVFAIEPMLNEGTYEIYTGDDGWTVFTADGKLSAHFEHTVLITENGPEILSRPVRE